MPPTWTTSCRSALDRLLVRIPVDLTPVPTPEWAGVSGRTLLIDGLRAAVETPLGPGVRGDAVGRPPTRNRLNELTFDLRLGERGHHPTGRHIGAMVVDHLETGRSPPDLGRTAGRRLDRRRAGRVPDGIDRPGGAGRGGRRVAVVRRGRLQDQPVDAPGSAAGRRRLRPEPTGTAMADHHYPLQALLYAVALHRYLRWRLRGYRPSEDLGGAAYLFVRGMTGPDVAITGGQPHGVFDWPIPWALVSDLSDLLDGRSAWRQSVGRVRGAHRAWCPARSPGRVVRGTRPAVRTVLSPFVEAGVFGAFEVELAATVLRLEPVASGEDLLALALAARAPRHGHVCVELDHVVDQVVSDDGGWAALRGSCRGPSRPVGPTGWTGHRSCAGPDAPADRRTRPLVWDGRRVYLERYWRYEVDVADELGGGPRPTRPRSHPSRARTGDAVEEALDTLFGTEPDSDQDLQRQAARWALTHGVSIIAGGPGTGKTHTIARILAAAHLVAEAEGGEVQAALAAPTGKAAARMAEAVQSQVRAMQRDGVIGTGLAEALSATEPTTVHRLLGHGDRTHFRHNRSDPLVHDLVVIDETSMVSLPLMAKLLDAVRPDARLVLVGDPFQLASIEAGTVMGDLVDRGGAGRPAGQRGGGRARRGRPTGPARRPGHRVASRPSVRRGVRHRGAGRLRPGRGRRRRARSAGRGTARRGVDP